MKCKHCGEEFEPVRSTGKFCGKRCRLLAFRGLKKKPNLMAAEKPLDAVSKLEVADPPQPREVVQGLIVPKVKPGPVPPVSDEPVTVTVSKPRSAHFAYEPHSVGQPNCPAGAVAGVLSSLPSVRRTDLSQPQFRKGSKI